MKITSTKVILAIILLILVALLLTMRIKASGARFVRGDSAIFSAESLRMVKYMKAHPEGIVLYQLYKPGDYPSSDYDITAVAYDPERRIIAIAQQSLFDAYHPGKPIGNQTEPRRGTAIIKLFDEKTSSFIKEIATKKDRIYGMSIDKRGRIAFAAGDAFFPQPGELCYVSLDDGIVHSVGKGAHFYFPAWSKDARRIYFSFSYENDKPEHIGYIDLAAPSVLKQVADGISVSISDRGTVAYLTNEGDIFAMQNGDGEVTLRPKRHLKHVDPRFTVGLRFVKGSEDIALVHALKMALQLRLIESPKYMKEMVLVSSIANGDFEAVYAKNDNSKK
jgi:hypothetical protein